MIYPNERSTLGKTLSSPEFAPEDLISPDTLDDWFPEAYQRNYVSALMGRGGFTRLRAKYFVRLWAYLLLKQQMEIGEGLQRPLVHLSPLQELVPCTHREAAELFYKQKDYGSDRAAGMMIDRLVALGLLEKQFDGQTLCLKVRNLPELVVSEPTSPLASVPLQPDAFNPRTDAIPIANLIINHYAEILKDVPVASATRKTIRCLRFWAQKYPTCMRVLRRSDNLNPVGISILYPVSSDSEERFFLPPSKSFFLAKDGEVDPFHMAVPGDSTCISVYVRTWIVDVAYMRADYICTFLEDMQQTLVQMQHDFPNLCDLYSMVIHPVHEALRHALGFQRTYQEAQRAYYWIYLALDRFLSQDMRKTVSSLKLR